MRVQIRYIAGLTVLITQPFAIISDRDSWSRPQKFRGYANNASLGAASPVGRGVCLGAPSVAPPAALPVERSLTSPFHFSNHFSWNTGLSSFARISVVVRPSRSRNTLSISFCVLVSPVGSYFPLSAFLAVLSTTSLMTPKRMSWPISSGIRSTLVFSP